MADKVRVAEKRRGSQPRAKSPFYKFAQYDQTPPAANVGGKLDFSALKGYQAIKRKSEGHAKLLKGLTKEVNTPVVKSQITAKHISIGEMSDVHIPLKQVALNEGNSNVDKRAALNLTGPRRHVGTTRTQTAFNSDQQLKAYTAVQTVQAQPTKRYQPNPQVVISVNCSKAMSTSNYRTLAKMVSKQRAKMHENEADESQAQSTADTGKEDNGFVSRQKVLESRIDKLRKLESKVNADTVCSKKNCPVSIDPRTTQERFGNDSVKGVNLNDSMNKEMRQRIQRFKSMQKIQTTTQQPKNRKIKDLTDCKEGTFKLNAEDRDIKVSAADEVTFNFMRRHQVVEETADIPLTELIRANQERALRNMHKSQEKMRRKESCMRTRNSCDPLSGSTSFVFSNGRATSQSRAYPGIIGTSNANLLKYASQNMLAIEDENQEQPDAPTPPTEATKVMAKTFASNMRSQKIGPSRTNAKSMARSMRGQQSQNLPSPHTHIVTRNQSKAGMFTQNSQAVKPAFCSSYAKSKKSLGQLSSVQQLQLAHTELMKRMSPELEHKDEFAASSLWQMAARANQEDFREIFMGQSQRDNSEQLEQKLCDLIKSSNSRPSLEPAKQVSPRTIKYLCNVIMRDLSPTIGIQIGKASQFQNAYLPTTESDRRGLSTPKSYSKKAAQTQAQALQRSTSIQSMSKGMVSTMNDNAGGRSYHKMLADIEEKYDPDGLVSGYCRPILNHQRDKLAQILIGKRKDANKTPHESSVDAQKAAEGDNGLFFGQSLKRTVNMVQNLHQELDASPSVKAKNRNRTKNDILEMTEKQFRGKKKSPKLILKERANKLYADHKERQGVDRCDIFTPSNVAHFHIDAFGDVIQSNHYDNQEPLGIEVPFHMLKPGLFQTGKSHSQMEVGMYQGGVSPTNDEMLLHMPKTSSNLRIEGSSRGVSARESRRGSLSGSQDSVFSSSASVRGDIIALMQESPQIDFNTKKSKRLETYNRILGTPGNLPTEMKVGKNEKMSVLLTKENDAEFDYFQKMELAQIARFDRTTALQAYKALTQAAKPIFSGSADHRINLLDAKKCQALLNISKENLSKVMPKCYELVEELKQKMTLLRNRRIFHGYWDAINDTQGCLPESRKGATMNLVKNEIYVFGGFSRDTYNDLKVFNTNTSKWREVKTEGSRVIPDPRVSHTMVNFQNKMVLFGGGGAYMPNLHMMPSFNDIWMFDCDRVTWTKLEGSGIPPKKRMYHAASCLGSLMLIHGGYSSEGKITLNDFNLFDIEVQKWIKTRVIMNGKVIESEAQYGATIDSEDSDMPKLQTIGARRGHCLATVFQNKPDRYQLISQSVPHAAQRLDRAASRDQQNRGMWIYERVFSRDEITKGQEIKEGFYLFGGQSRDEGALNDLWLIKPEYYTNKRMIHEMKFQYTCKDPELTLNVKQITNYAGQPPCPRYGAAMVHLPLSKSGQQLLVIYGGRNDKIYEHTGGVALNDISLYNINLNQWETLAMFGQIPQGRWKHCMIAMSNIQQVDGIMILGGVNLHQHCRSKIFTFQLMSKKREKANSQRQEKSQPSSPYQAIARQQEQAQQPARENHKLTDQNLKKITSQPVTSSAETGSVLAQRHHQQSRAGAGAGAPPMYRHGSNIRDDVSQKSAMKQKLFTKVQTAMVNFAPDINETGSVFAKPGVADKLGLAMTAAPVFPAIIETIAANSGGKDFSKLNLGSQYSSFQEGLKQRLDLIKDVLIKSREQSPDKKSYKRQLMQQQQQ